VNENKNRDMWYVQIWYSLSNIEMNVENVDTTVTFYITTLALYKNEKKALLRMWQSIDVNFFALIFQIDIGTFTNWSPNNLLGSKSTIEFLLMTQFYFFIFSFYRKMMWIIGLCLILMLYLTSIFANFYLSQKIIN
jgi:hypothetical protein